MAIGEAGMTVGAAGKTGRGLRMTSDGAKRQQKPSPSGRGLGEGESLTTDSPAYTHAPIVIPA